MPNSVWNSSLHLCFRHECECVFECITKKNKKNVLLWHIWNSWGNGRAFSVKISSGPGGVLLYSNRHTQTKTRTHTRTHTESSDLPTCPLKIKRTTPPFPRWARGPNNTYKKLKWTSVHPSPMAVTCSTPTFLYQIVWKCMEKGNSAGEGESWDCERTATPANWAASGPVGNEQCRQEIKEWEKGERERAEVSRSRTATSHLSCRRGRSWRQMAAKSPSRPPLLSSFGMLFSTPILPTATPSPHFLSQFSASFICLTFQSFNLCPHSKQQN